MLMVWYGANLCLFLIWNRIWISRTPSQTSILTKNGFGSEIFSSFDLDVEKATESLSIQIPEKISNRHSENVICEIVSSFWIYFLLLAKAYDLPDSAISTWIDPSHCPSVPLLGYPSYSSPQEFRHPCLVPYGFSFGLGI